METPEPSTPATVAAVLADVVSGFDYDGSLGIGFPAVIVDGVVKTANNIHKSWIGVNARDLFEESTGRAVAIVNDADAAALAEARFGVAKGVSGLVVVMTFGTGIGSGFLVHGRLVPNVELGQLELEGHRPAEDHFSAKARRIENLGWDAWGDRANSWLTHVNAVFSPSLIAVGGGVAKNWDRWCGRIDPALPVERAALSNNAGVVGAASLVAWVSAGPNG